jgi:hypothetical protein
MAIATTPPRLRTAATVASSTRLMQSQRMPPDGVATWSARWPIANAGSVPIPTSPGASGSIRFRWVARSSPSVVQT